MQHCSRGVCMLLVIGFYKKNLKLFIELKVFICYINVIT